MAHIALRRSLESFLELLQSKRQCLAVPDALITAVGTKLYEHDAAATGQHQWREDAVWLSQLDWGWDLELAREACYRALAEVRLVGGRVGDGGALGPGAGQGRVLPRAGRGAACMWVWGRAGRRGA